jgi:hypothetical protein
MNIFLHTRCRKAHTLFLSLCAIVTAFSPAALAQGNYEIQVYSSDTVPKGNTMVEMHSNYTASGARFTTDGTYPTNHQEHETLEITRGWNSWFETGLYVFTSLSADHGWDWVGDHIRPRVRAPDSWHLPVGLSLSTEIGYQRPIYFADSWTIELRPIIDKKIGRWYASLNPTFDKSFHGPSKNLGWDFSPNVKVSYDFSKAIAGGLEYYGAVGSLASIDPIREQQQQFFPAIDLNLSPKWEINFGVGVGVTASTDHLIYKGIIGYRFGKSEQVPGTESKPPVGASVPH